MKFTSLVFVFVSFNALGQADSTPFQWRLYGEKSETEFQFSKDEKIFREGRVSGKLVGLKEANSYGRIQQTIQAQKYLNKRIRFSAWLKTKDVRDWSGLFVRVYGAAHLTYVFDNMQNRAIRGTSNWARYEIIVDVDELATQISFGAGVSGPGTLWIDDAKFEAVSRDVKVTAKPEPIDEPRNLNLEEM